MTASLRLPFTCSLLLGAALALPPLAGCGAFKASSTEADSANEAVDSLESTTAEGALLAVAMDGVDSTKAADQAALQAAENAGRLLLPAGCVTATASGPTVTYQLTGCHGPFGLLDVKGTVTLTFAVDAHGVSASARATGLAINGSRLDIDATATYSQSGPTRTAVVTTSGQASGPRGTDFSSRSGSYTATWDDSCYSVDGNWSTTAVGHTWTTSVSGYEHCSGMCPAQGGTLSYTGGLSGVTVTVTFNGDDTASWTSSSGRGGAVVVSCGATS